MTGWVKAKFLKTQGTDTKFVIVIKIQVQTFTKMAVEALFQVLFFKISLLANIKCILNVCYITEE